MTIAQEPQSAKYQGMPRSAIAAGVVDVVQSPTPECRRRFQGLRAESASALTPAPRKRCLAERCRKFIFFLRDRAR